MCTLLRSASRLQMNAPPYFLDTFSFSRPGNKCYEEILQCAVFVSALQRISQLFLSLSCSCVETQMKSLRMMSSQLRIEHKQDSGRHGTATHPTCHNRQQQTRRRSPHTDENPQQCGPRCHQGHCKTKTIQGN